MKQLKHLIETDDFILDDVLNCDTLWNQVDTNVSLKQDHNPEEQCCHRHCHENLKYDILFPTYLHLLHIQNCWQQGEELSSQNCRQHSLWFVCPREEPSRCCNCLWKLRNVLVQEQ